MLNVSTLIRKHVSLQFQNILNHRVEMLNLTISFPDDLYKAHREVSTDCSEFSAQALKSFHAQLYFLYFCEAQVLTPVMILGQTRRCFQYCA